MAPGRITLYIATSLDGFIADEGGGVDWLEDYQDVGDEEGMFEAFFADVDASIMGARTYEQVLDWGVWPYEDSPVYVATSRDLETERGSVELVQGEPAALARRLTDEHDHVWLVGGADLAQRFLAAGAVDEIHLTVVPLLLGEGVPLFGQGAPRQRLALEGTRRFENGLVELRYRVLHR